MTNIMENEINKVIKEIVFTIKNKNINVFELCEKLCLPEEKFIYYLSSPSKNLSFYLSMLDVVYECFEV